MFLVGKKILEDFKERHSDAISSIDSWRAEIKEATWQNPHDLKLRYPKASIIGSQKVVFNLCGNKYRLFVIVSYKNQVIMVKKIGTHSEYDKWDLN
jgi:mRNA interferase HigB